MLEELAKKELDIYISLAIGILCTVLGIFLDRYLGRGEPKGSGKARSHHGGITIDQIIRISVTIQSQGKITGEANLLAFVAVAITVVVYAFFRQEILLASLVLTSAVIGLWLGVVLNSIYYGYFSGFGWVTYVLLMLLFAAGAIHVIGEAIAPLYAPQYFSSWQESVHLYGLSVLFRAVGVNGIAWLLTHAAGVALLFYALWKAMLSMLFYATASSGKREENSFTHSRWVRVAAQNARPMRTAVSLLVLLICSYYLVSGRFFVWYQNEFPSQVRNIVNYVMHGSQGR